MRLILLLLFSIFCLSASAQDYGEYPRIEQARLLNDLELLHQGLDQFHSGMYWYTPKDSVDRAFETARKQIDGDLNVLEFYKLIAPLVGLSREDHTNIFLPAATKTRIQSQATFLPFTVVFLGQQLYVVKDGSKEGTVPVGSRINTINGVSPREIVRSIGSLFASDGYIQAVKYSDLEGFAFARNYYYYFGRVDRFEIEVEGVDEPFTVTPLSLAEIRKNLAARAPNNPEQKEKEWLEFKLLNDSTAYLGIHTFDNAYFRESKTNRNYSRFLEQSFASITERNIKTLVIDMSENAGGKEGNEGMLYSYLAANYRKYKKVRAKTQKATLDNGVDKPIVLKTFGLLERVFGNTKMPDGSYERKVNAGYGLMAFKKTPKNTFDGKVYVIISPVTYSGGSEFSNMMYTNKRGIFVGQETGGGYYGNTSGYGRELELPNSHITIDLPALQFVMNVEGLPFGRGVIPHHEVIPTFEQYRTGENVALNFILELERAK